MLYVNLLFLPNQQKVLSTLQFFAILRKIAESGEADSRQGHEDWTSGTALRYFKGQPLLLHQLWFARPAADGQAVMCLTTRH